MGRLLALAACLAVLAGCGSGGSGASRDGEPGKGKPAIRLATKNFTEQFILGQLYKQALEAKGFTVDLKENVGSSELVDEALKSGGIDMYPEYIGVIVSELADEERRPRSEAETYERARAFEQERGFTLLERSPGFDALAAAVTPEFAAEHDLRTTADLKRLGRFRFGGPPENETRFQGAVGMREVYDLDFQYVPLEIGKRYEALDEGRVDVTSVFTTEGQLAQEGRYVVLEDPESIFGFQNIAPVVDREVLKRQGPALAETLDAVSGELTNRALQRMNGAVDLQGRQPAEVAREFLREHALL